MSKRPFTKIRRLDKKENNDVGEQNKEELKDEFISRENSNKPPKLSLEKKRILISNGEEQKKTENNLEAEPKISINSKPNLFKGKREGGKLLINSNRNTVINEPTEQNYGEAPKPTPIMIKKRLNFQPKNKERENVLVQEESPEHIDAQDSKQLNIEESNAVKRKPDLKIKRFLQKRQPSEKINDIQQSNQYNKSNDQPFNVQASATAQIQYRQINIEPSVVSISEGRIEKQRKRTSDLKNLLNLEMDLYQQTLSVSSVTSYQIYINKIKSGFLKNSQDQAFDDTNSSSCQTLSYEITDFTNQCPQDYSFDINKIEAINQNEIFNQFLLKVAPIIQELIKPTASITQPPIFLLAFRPNFKAFLKCPYPIFIYQSQQYKIDLIVMGEKLYITEGQIESVLMIGKNIIAGLKNGYLVMWNGENSKTSRLYQQIKQFTQTTNFQLPTFSTHQLERFSSYASQFSIIGLSQQQRSQFASLDQSGKLVRWGIQYTITNSQIIRPLSLVELRNLTQHWALQAYSFKKRDNTYYINTSIGIICLQNQQIKQKLDNENTKIIAFEIPKKTSLVYVICENNTLKIYNQLYSHKLFELSAQIGFQSLTDMIIPQLQHDNRQLVILFAVYLIDTMGKVLQLKLLQNKIQSIKQSSEEQHQGRKDKNVIFRGVHRIGESLQTIKLMRDLKISSSTSKISVNMEKSIPNLKSILEKNRQIMSMLQSENSVIF